MPRRRRPPARQCSATPAMRTARIQRKESQLGAAPHLDSRERWQKLSAPAQVLRERVLAIVELPQRVRRPRRGRGWSGCHSRQRHSPRGRCARSGGVPAGARATTPSSIDSPALSRSFWPSASRPRKRQARVADRPESRSTGAGLKGASPRVRQGGRRLGRTASRWDRGRPAEDDQRCGRSRLTGAPAPASRRASELPRHGRLSAGPSSSLQRSAIGSVRRQLAGFIQPARKPLPRQLPLTQQSGARGAARPRRVTALRWATRAHDAAAPPSSTPRPPRRYLATPPPRADTAGRASLGRCWSTPTAGSGSLGARAREADTLARAGRAALVACVRKPRGHCREGAGRHAGGPTTV